MFITFGLCAVAAAAANVDKAKQGLQAKQSIFGAIGTPGQAFISELSRRIGGLVPFSLLPHASWATPRVAPMIRMALTPCRAPGLVAASIHTHWRCDAGAVGGEGEGAE